MRMDHAERQALHALRDDLYDAAITDRILRHLQTHGKITKAEKYECSRIIETVKKMKQLLRILQNKKEPLQTLVTAIKLESQNEWIVNKLEKKIKLMRKRSLQQTGKKGSYFSQLDDIADVVYNRGYMAVYGKPMKVQMGTSHLKLVDDIGNVISDVEDCREMLNGSEDGKFKDVVKDYKEKRDNEIDKMRKVCADVVKRKNDTLAQKNERIQELKGEVDKKSREIEEMKKEIDRKIEEGVQERLKIFHSDFDSRRDSITTMTTQTSDDTVTEDNDSKENEKERTETDAEIDRDQTLVKSSSHVVTDTECDNEKVTRVNYYKTYNITKNYMHGNQNKMYL